MEREDLLKALEERNWEAVVQGGAQLYGQHHCEPLGEAARDATQAGLFVLENPTFSEVASDLARIAADQLRNTR